MNLVGILKDYKTLKIRCLLQKNTGKVDNTATRFEIKKFFRLSTVINVQGMLTMLEINCIKLMRNQKSYLISKYRKR